MSAYRFHDHLPIRFRKSLRRHINWREEKLHTQRPEWRKAVADGGAWVDYATVFYWYQNDPAGFKHQPLRPLDERSETIVLPVEATLALALSKLPVDARAANTFDAQSDMDRVAVLGAYEGAQTRERRHRPTTG